MSSLIATALQDVSNWVGHTEDDEWGSQMVGQYWRALGQASPGASVAWSAAYLVSLVNSVLPDALSKTGAHIYYVKDALSRRLSKRPGYWAYDARDAPPVQAGDIVVKSRGQRLTTWDDVVATSNFREMHGSLVVAVAGNRAKIVGGNVDNAVREREVALDSSGRLAGPGWVSMLKLNDDIAAPSNSVFFSSPAPGLSPTARIALTSARDAINLVLANGGI